ncbi:acetyl-CoA synthetase [SAR202 cluster bacterium AC-647-N09_OGT_505m]|nr:acetyl-CoA synthetase [SAR202 cluster bacterium AC-647-N09_OGT_505m]
MTTADVLQKARQDGRALLTEVESKELIQGTGIPIVETRLARSKSQAVSISRELGLPVVLKIVSPDVVHKSDVGGVKIGLSSLGQVRTAYDDILSSTRAAVPSASIQGVSVQKMADPGVEVIIGATKDPQFGHVIMFGLGGVLVELLRDVSLRLVPLTARDARLMIREIRSLPMLQGFRQYPPCDLEKLEEAILNLSHFLEKHPEIKELDLNPILCYPKGLVAVDARVVLEELNPTS